MNIDSLDNDQGDKGRQKTRRGEQEKESGQSLNMYTMITAEPNQRGKKAKRSRCKYSNCGNKIT
ncbi:hypothetical protein HI914_01264 [Erysiphe necator]|nr:hypothetical protein HI914_01264 [Erysiphe necator]